MAMFSSSVDLPMPVLPMTYMWRARSRRLMPKGVSCPREFVCAKYVILSGSSCIFKYSIQPNESTGKKRGRATGVARPDSEFIQDGDCHQPPAPHVTP